MNSGRLSEMFEKPGRTHTESGAELARALPETEVQKILDWSLGSPGANITYPDSLRKAVTAISFAARGALGGVWRLVGGTRNPIGLQG
jgi:hypothetical protein